jgi:putative transposase
MSDYRRYRVSGRIYFFTINLLERRADLVLRHIEQDAAAIRAGCCALAPFDISSVG